MYYILDVYKANRGTYIFCNDDREFNKRLTFVRESTLDRYLQRLSSLIKFIIIIPDI